MKQNTTIRFSKRKDNSDPHVSQTEPQVSNEDDSDEETTVAAEAGDPVFADSTGTIQTRDAGEAQHQRETVRHVTLLWFACKRVNSRR